VLLLWLLALSSTVFCSSSVVLTVKFIMVLRPCLPKLLLLCVEQRIMV
jgi:hypothetical protein